MKIKLLSILYNYKLNNEVNMKKISFKSNNKNIFKFILNIVLKTHKPDKSYKKYKYNK